MRRIALSFAVTITTILASVAPSMAAEVVNVSAIGGNATGTVTYDRANGTASATANVVTSGCLEVERASLTTFNRTFQGSFLSLDVMTRHNPRVNPDTCAQTAVNHKVSAQAKVGSIRNFGRTTLVVKAPVGARPDPYQFVNFYPTEKSSLMIGDQKLVIETRSKFTFFNKNNASSFNIVKVLNYGASATFIANPAALMEKIGEINTYDKASFVFSVSSPTFQSVQIGYDSSRNMFIIKAVDAAGNHVYEMNTAGTIIRLY
jgi:hypothetical protein